MEDIGLLLAHHRSGCACPRFPWLCLSEIPAVSEIPCLSEIPVSMNFGQNFRKPYVSMNFAEGLSVWATGSACA
jgi:hypothetical protein